MNTNVLFLCTQLTGYFEACITHMQHRRDANVKVYHWPVSQSAPFQQSSSRINAIIKHPRTDILKDCKDFNPSVIYIGGWVDKDYLKVARHFKKKGIPVVCGLDNVWRATFRQRMSCLFSDWLVKPYFDYMWVAGHRQYQFARRLGYAPQQILRDLYVADIHRFSENGKKVFNKYLLFVGRFEKEKGVEELYNAFNGLSSAERKGWKLRMIGNGSLKEKLVATDDIIIEDFMQPQILAEQTKDAGGFILPSIREPWGVVVQEFAAASLPLILSNKVNAGEQYLIPNYNGYRFTVGDNNNLRKTLVHFFSLPEDQIRKMGARSHKLAFVNDPEIWMAQLLSVIPSSN